MRLLVADDQLIAREGIAALLTRSGHTVVATASRAEQVLGMVARHGPDIVVLDLRMPPTFTDEGLQLAIRVRKRFVGVAALLLSQHPEPATASALVEQAGSAVGYLLKDRVLDADVLTDALARLHAGGVVIDPTLVDGLVRRPRPMTVALSGREREVLCLIAQGFSDRGIAQRLQVAPTTVGTHVQSVYRKLDLPEDANVNRRVGAVLAYLRAQG